jgi:hypothetical protein
MTDIGDSLGDLRSHRKEVFQIERDESNNDVVI